MRNQISTFAFYLFLTASSVFTFGCSPQHLSTKTLDGLNVSTANAANIAKENDAGLAVAERLDNASGSLYLSSEKLLGSTDLITYNSVTYLIGSDTTEQMTTLIRQLHDRYPNGNVTLSVQIGGTVNAESGRFPNPMATFRVINLSALTTATIPMNTLPSKTTIGSLYLSSPNLFGGVDHITVNSTTYLLIGTETTADIKALINNLHNQYPNGDVALAVEFTGTITTESGRMPNPMVKFQAVNLTGLVQR